MIDCGFGVSLDTIEKAVNARHWRNEQLLNQFFRQVGLISEEHHKKWLENIETSSIKMFSIIDSKTAYCFGVCGLTSIDYIHRKAEISCYTSPSTSSDIINYNLEKSAIKTIIHFGFHELNLNRIWAETFETHADHLKMLDELGLQREGVLKQSYFKNGKYIDSIIHAALRSGFVGK